MVINIPAYVREIMDRIERSGYESFAVGGSLRDILLGKEPHDWDVTTSALPETVASLFPDKHVIPTGLKHGTVTVVCEGYPIEITTYRVDGEYTDSRRPDKVEFTRNIEDDLSRRDFTVNALAYNEQRGLLDLFGGKTDLDNKIIRAVGDPARRFTEDALRIMRAFRFSAQLGFDIEKNTLAAAKELSPRLKNIARERIGSEFLRLLASKYPERSLSMMENVIFEILPIKEIEKNRYTLVEKLPSFAETRLSFLLYGKTREELLNVSHYLRLSNEQKRIFTLLATPAELDFELTPISARRFLQHYGSEAEAATRVLLLLKAISAEFAALVAAEKEKSPCLSVGELAINGKDIIFLELASGRGVGELLAKLLDEVIKDPSLNEREKLVELAQKEK